MNNDSSLFVVGVINIDSSSCVAKPDSTSVLLTSGTYDTAFAQGYSANLLIGNQLSGLASFEQQRTETSRVAVRGAEVTLTRISGEEIAGGRYSTVGTGFVDPAAGTAPSYAAVNVNVIPAGLTNLPSRILAKIRVFGNTLGGTNVTSSELDFPITVCEGCLVEYPSEGDPTEPTYKCPSAASSDSADATAPCVRGQDQPFSCTLCSAAYDLCLDPCDNPAYGGCSK